MLLCQIKQHNSIGKTRCCVQISTIRSLLLTQIQTDPYTCHPHKNDGLHHSTHNRVLHTQINEQNRLSRAQIGKFHLFSRSQLEIINRYTSRGAGARSRISHDLYVKINGPLPPTQKMGTRHQHRSPVFSSSIVEKMLGRRTI